MHFDSIEKANLIRKLRSDTKIKYLSSDPKVGFEGLEIIFGELCEFHKLAFEINLNYASYLRLFDLGSNM
jgi:hypothetical protein